MERDTKKEEGNIRDTEQLLREVVKSLGSWDGRKRLVKTESQFTAKETTRGIHSEKRLMLLLLPKNEQRRSERRVPSMLDPGGRWWGARER